MELLVPALISVVSCVAGAVVSWLINDSRNRRELEELELDMCEQVQERYNAYVALETRVRKAIRGFDRRAFEFKRRLQNQKHNIEELKTALDKHEAFAQESLSDTSFLGIPVTVEQAVAKPGPKASAGDPFADALSQMDDWEQRVDSDLEHKNVELERQSTQISQLTDQVKRLEPLSRTVFKREEEIEAWKARYSELETALSLQSQAMEDVVNQLGPKADELSDNEAALSTLRTRFEQRLAAKDAEVRELSERVENLAREAELAHDYAQRNEELQAELTRATDESRDMTLQIEQLAEIAGQVEQLVELNGELDSELGVRMDEVAVLNRRIVELTAEAERVAELAALNEELVGRNGELVTRSGELEDDLRQRAEAVAMLERQIEELEQEAGYVAGLVARTADLEFEIKERSAELLVLQRHCERVESEGCAARDALELRIVELEPQAARVIGLEARAQELEAELAGTEEAFDSLSTEHEALVDELRDRVARIEQERETRVAELEHELAQSRASATATAETADEVRRQLVEVESALSEAVRRAAQGEARVDELEARTTEDQAELEGLRTRLHEAEALLHASAQRAADNEARMAEYERRIAYEEAQLAQWKADLGAAEKRLTDAEDRRVSGEQRAESTIGTLRADLGAVTGQLQELRSLHDGLVAKFEWQTGEMAAKDGEIVERDVLIERLVEQVQGLQGQLSQTSESLNGEKSRIGQLMAQLDDMEEKAATRTHRISEAQHLLEALRPVIETLEHTLVDGETYTRKTS